MGDELKTRVAVTSATLRRLAEVTRGFGVNSNDSAINALIDLACLHTGEQEELLAAYALREELNLHGESDEDEAAGNQKAHQGLPSGLSVQSAA